MKWTLAWIVRFTVLVGIVAMPNAACPASPPVGPGPVVIPYPNVDGSVSIAEKASEPARE